MHIINIQMNRTRLIKPYLSSDWRVVVPRRSQVGDPWRRSPGLVSLCLGARTSSSQSICSTVRERTFRRPYTRAHTEQRRPPSSGQSNKSFTNTKIFWLKAFAWILRPRLHGREAIDSFDDEKKISIYYNSLILLVGKTGW